jgi:hypothetical protein
MATLVLVDASLVINAVDLSDHVRSITLNYSADMVGDDNMGDVTHIFKGGLKNWSFDVEFSQDYAASEVDATLFAIVGTTFVVTAKPTSGAVSATNPSFSGTGILESYNPLGGAVGELATATVTIQSAGDLTRSVTP